MSTTHDLVVIGASAGGLQALFTILGSLPPTLPAAVVVVVHTRSNGGVLPQVLGRRSALPVEAAADGLELEPGRVYVAPADRHVLVARKALRVVRGPRENGFRPAVDPLFRTAARSRGAGVLGVILSGALDDGAYGLSAIVRGGGIAIVQDPDDAEVPGMPVAALRLTHVHAVVPSSRIADAIVQFCHQPAGQEVRPMPRRDEPEPQRPADDAQVADMMALNGPPSPITCPACGGALWETEEDGVVRYACHVGHQYAPDSLLAEHGEAVEQALWSAVRVLEQHAELRQRMSKRAQDAGITTVAAGFAEDSRDYHVQAQHIRQLLFGQRDRIEPDPPALRRKAQAR
jgi:two-component system, chemotaxis family, protein-glutamate methylesterase/glutaminase